MVITSLDFVGSTVSATASGAGWNYHNHRQVVVEEVYQQLDWNIYCSCWSRNQVDSWSKVSYSGAEYTFMIGLGTYRQSQKVLVMHDGTTAFSQEYGIMFSPEQQVSIVATISSNNVRS